MIPRPINVAATLTASLVYWGLRLLGATWRIDFPQRQELEYKLNQGEKFLLAFWHGEYLPLFILLRGLKGCVFTSDSFRGRVIQKLCKRFGFACEILTGNYQLRQRQLLQATNRYPAVALAVDGPLGPYHVIKMGLIHTARASGHPIIPLVCRGHRQWQSRKRWDRFAVPLPFAQVGLAIGEPITVNPANQPKRKDDVIAVLARSMEKLGNQLAL